MKLNHSQILSKVLLFSLIAILIGAKPAFAVDLLAEYRFEGNLNPIQPGSTLTPFGTSKDANNHCNSSSSFTGDSWHWASDGCVRGGGFRIDVDEDISSSYSIGVRFEYGTIEAGWEKIIDFNNMLTDDGFYFKEHLIKFYPITAAEGTNRYSANTTYDLVVTRDGGTKKFTAYIVNSAGDVFQEFTFIDTAGQALPFIQNGKTRLGFFFDDTATSNEATNSGTVYNVKIWRDALTKDQIKDAMSNHSPVITSNGGGSTASIPVFDGHTGTVTTVTATDIDNDTLTYRLNGGADVSKFTIDASSGVLTFINPPDYYSPTDANSDNHYQVTVQVDDGKGGTADQEITVQVSLVASATPDSYSVFEDGSLTVPVSGVLANDHDANNDPLTAVLDADVSNGVLTLNPDGSFDYTPTPFFSGTDTFTYHANDGTFDSNIVTVTITVNHINHPPVAHPDAHITHEDIPLIVSVANGVLHNDTDPDVHDTLLATKVTDPGHGSVTLNLDGSLTFTPDANYNGPDSFTYKANDGHTDSNTVTVDIAVAAVNDAPVALPDSYGTQEDTTLKFNAALGVLRNDTDPDGNPVHVRTFSHPANGTLLLNPDGSLECTPNPNFNGDDSFTYTANDGQLDSAPVQVFIHVSAVNDPPKALPDAYSVHEDTGLSIDVAHGLLHNDSDPEHNILTVKLGNNVANGTLHLKTDGSFDYTPKNNFNGTDSFTYTVNDGALDSTPVTVTLTVDAVNDAPVAVGDAYSVAEDTLLTVPLAKGLLLNDSDPDGDSLLALLVDSPVNGIIQIKLDGTFSYQPNFNFSGADFFTYRVNVGKLDSPTFAIVNITVNHVNKPPLGVADSYKTQEDTALKVIATATTGLLANDLDLDHDILTATAYTLPAHGSLSPGLHGEFIPPIRIITARTALPILPLMDSHSAQ